MNKRQEENKLRYLSAKREEDILNKEFYVLVVSRYDLIYSLGISRKRALEITDKQMSDLGMDMANSMNNDKVFTDVLGDAYDSLKYRQIHKNTP